MPVLPHTGVIADTHRFYKTRNMGPPTMLGERKKIKERARITRHTGMSENAVADQRPQHDFEVTFPSRVILRVPAAFVRVNGYSVRSVRIG